MQKELTLNKHMQKELTLNEHAKTETKCNLKKLLAAQ